MHQHVLWASSGRTEQQSCGGPEPGRQSVSRDGGREDCGMWVRESSSSHGHHNHMWEWLWGSSALCSEWCVVDVYIVHL